MAALWLILREITTVQTISLIEILQRLITMMRIEPCHLAAWVTDSLENQWWMNHRIQATMVLSMLAVVLSRKLGAQVKSKWATLSMELAQISLLH